MRLLLPLLALAPLVTACASNKNPTGYHEHWTVAYVPQSVGRYTLGYDAERDGPSYRDFQWRKKQSINLTLSRHLLNQNPDNPFQPESSWYPAERGNHSLVPDFWNYLHVESLVFGGIFYGTTGVFIPIPIDSIIGTFDTGGIEEFGAGINEVTEPVGVVVSAFLYEAIPADRDPGDHTRPRYPGNQDNKPPTWKFDSHNVIYDGPLSR